MTKCYNTNVSENFPYKELPNQWLDKEGLTWLDNVRRITENPIGLRNEKGIKGPPLPPDDFKLARNNFPCYFTKDKGEEVNIGRAYRTSKRFQKWFSDHPEKIQKLVEELGTYRFLSWDVNRETNRTYLLPDDPKGPEMEHKLYEAYLQMREYVDDDRELFK
jgi:hypothetical protein